MEETKLDRGAKLRAFMATHKIKMWSEDGTGMANAIDWSRTWLTNVYQGQPEASPSDELKQAIVNYLAGRTGIPASVVAEIWT